MKAMKCLSLLTLLLSLALPAWADYRIILPTVGNTTSVGDVDFYTLSGDSKVTQFLGSDHVLNAGDTFIQNQVKLLFVSDTLNGSTENVYTGLQKNKLYLSASGLTGFVDPTGKNYLYNPNQFAAIYWDYYIGATLFHDKIADVKLASGGGILDDGVFGLLNPTPTGTVHLDGTLFNIQPGVFWSGATDLSTLKLLNINVNASLRGSNNVTTNSPTLVGGQPVSLLLGVHSNVDLSITPTPEPATMLLMGLGAMGAAVLRRRNGRKS